MSGEEKAASMAGNMSDKAAMLDAMTAGELAGLLSLTSPELRATLLQALTAALSDGERAQLMSSTATADERADREAAEAAAAAAQATTDAEDGAADTQAAAEQLDLEVATRDDTIKHSAAQLATSQQDVARLEATCSDQQNTITAQDSTLTELSTQLIAYSKDVEALQKQVGYLQGQRDTLLTQIKEKDELQRATQQKLQEEQAINRDLFNEHQRTLTQMKLLEQSHAEVLKQLKEVTAMYDKERRLSETSRKVKHALYGVYSPPNQPSIEKV